MENALWIRRFGRRQVLEQDGGVRGEFEGAAPIADGVVAAALLHGEGAEVVEHLGLGGIDPEALAPLLQRGAARSTQFASAY